MSFTPKNAQTKKLKCQNSDPDASKYWTYAPNGGCTEIVEVDSRTDKVLCYKSSMQTLKGWFDVFCLHD